MGYMIDNYEIVEKIGSGAMGDVFKGHDPKTNQYVAIKILSDDLIGNERAVKRFKREVAQTIQLNHPNLISAYATGEFKGRLYYVMEYVEGTTIKKTLLSKGAYSEPRALELTIQVASSLEYAAKFGIIHRDIKPENIMITYDGKAKLCDMGLAKSIDSETKLTVMGTVLGTPHYMSPEQAQGDVALDERSDISSLGATYYHMLTGYPPYEGNDPIAIMTALLDTEPIPIRERNPKVSPNTCAVVAKMMKKDRSARYQSFTELLDDLKKLQRGETTVAEKEGLAPIEKPKATFKDSHTPSEHDVLFGQIAVHNKIVSSQKMEGCLDRQENLYLMGISLDLADTMLERKILSAQQKAALQKAKIQFVLDRGDEVFLKVCASNNFLSPGELTECKKLQKTGTKGLAGLFLAQGKISGEKRQKIYACMKQVIAGEEEKAVLKASIDSGLISQSQAEKCSRIYSNNIVMGKYRSIGAVLVEKSFLSQDALDVVLWAVRRSTMTKKPVNEYIKSKIIQA